MIRWPQGGRSRLERQLAKAADIGDLRGLARRRLPKPVFDYADGGAGDETARRRNTEALDAIEFLPRVLNDVSAVDPSIELFGRRQALPFIVCPVGLTRAMHPHGEIGAARAAERAGVPYVLSTMASASPEQIAEHAPGVDRWFQLYLSQDHDHSLALVQRAAAAGFTTLVLTVDTPVGGERLRDVRNGMTLPPSIAPGAVVKIATRPAWWWNAITRDPIDFASLPKPAAEPGKRSKQFRTTRVFDSAATWDDLKWLRDNWSGRVLVKSVMRPDDAQRVVELGADGVIVSNHGGRQVEQATATISALPAIRAALGPRPTVLLDSGIRTGAHAAAALALGADGVGLGRAYVYGLAAGGEPGVDRAIGIVGDGLKRMMALLGTPTIADLTPDLVRNPPA